MGETGDIYKSDSLKLTAFMFDKNFVKKQKNPLILL
jgi:hypothetical protein